MDRDAKLNEARFQLVEAGGRTAQDLGLGRIVGQILVYLYLQPGACSLDEIEQEIGLSKAAVSIGARQLEQLGLIKQVWLKGERKKYYRSADNLAQALQNGLLAIVRKRVEDFGEQLESTSALLNVLDDGKNDDVSFLRKRVKRAGRLQKGLERVLGNSFVKILTKATNEVQN
jgi:HTH-type transcriptional regulator, glycine betaine synthesis regulator